MVLDTEYHEPHTARLLLHALELLLGIVLGLLRDVRVAQGSLVAASTVTETVRPRSQGNQEWVRINIHVVGVLALRGVGGGLDVAAVVLLVEDLAGVLLRLVGGVWEREVLEGEGNGGGT